jgi:hypothetical protein
MPLTDLAIRNAKAGAKPVKMADGGGMYLYVTPAGGKLWRLKYRIAGREKLLAMGGYPEVGLGEARRRREAARAMLAEGKDPSREKKREKLRSLNEAENSFAVIAAEFCDKSSRAVRCGRQRRHGASGARRRDDKAGSRWAWVPAFFIAHPAQAAPPFDCWVQRPRRS